MPNRKTKETREIAAGRLEIRDGYLLVCFEGQLNAKDLAKTTDEIHSNIQYQTMNDLWDLRACTVDDLSYGQVQNIFEHIRSRGFRQHKRSAILVSSEHHFGLSRIYQALSDNERKDLLSIGIFRGLEAAQQWLREEPGQGTPKAPIR